MLAVRNEFNVKRYYQTKRAKVTGSELVKKLKQLEAGLRQSFFTGALESNENATNASYEVATLIARHCKQTFHGS